MEFSPVQETVTAKEETRLRDRPSQDEDSVILYTLKNGELDKKRWQMYQNLLGESRSNADKKAIAMHRKQLNKSGNRRSW